MTKHKHTKAKRRAKIKEREAKVERNTAQCKQTTRITVMPPEEGDTKVAAPVDEQPAAMPSPGPSIGQNNTEDEFDKAMKEEPDAHSN